MKWARRIGVGLLIAVLLICGLALRRAMADLRECRERGTALEQALNEANETIEQMNGQIDDAQGEAGSSFEEMSDALESLAPGETVEVPSAMRDSR